MFKKKKSKFTTGERKLIFGMSFLMGIRMLGMSFIMPIFSIFAVELTTDSSYQMVGVAVGVFALSQALFQIPMGRLSDRWGRKEATILGLVIYLIGMVLSGISTDIYQLTIFRFIAGAGAVSGITLAWMTEGVGMEYRNTALAYIGMTIGITTMVGLPLSFVVYSRISHPMPFFICGALTFGAIIYTAFYLKNNDFDEPHSIEDEVHYRFDYIKKIMTNLDLLRLNLTGFIYSFCLTGVFTIIPLLIKEQMKVESMWIVMTPPAIVGTALMYFFARQADKRGFVKIASLGLFFELIGIFIPIFSSHLYGYMASLLFFYIGHCILSPVLPVAVSRYPGTVMKGTVMSFYTSSQFMGTFVGGLLAGAIAEISFTNVFFMLASVNMVGIVAVFGFKDFKKSAPERENV